MSHTAVTTRGTGLLLARDTGLLGSPCPQRRHQIKVGKDADVENVSNIRSKRS